jgi:cysteine desulfurase
MRRVYLDHNATTPLAPEVFAAMEPYLNGEYGNASSIHAWGQRAKAAVEEARESVARLLGAQTSEIVFTSGGTESNNLAIFGAVEAARTNSGVKHIVTTAIEHHAVLYPVKALERRGMRATYVPVSREGVVDPADIERAITAETVLITVMHANNELGAIQPIEAIAGIARDHGIVFHTDAVQSVGKIPVNAAAPGVRLLSLSAHKLYGPKGVGALYVRKGTPLRPLMYGGHHERDRRPGTENVAGIVGLGTAAELALEHGPEELERAGKLRDWLENGILQTVPDACLNSGKSPRLPTTSSISFEGIDGEGFVIAMDLAGIACSAGAACSSGSLEPSHVLSAIGKNREEARSTIRFSLGRTTTREDIDYALEIIPQVVKRLRSLSPTYREQAVSS